MDKNYTYILRCSDGSLYTGWTNDIDKRIACHNEGNGAKFTRSRRPVELVYLENFSTKEQAMSREWEIKQLNKKEKEELVRDYAAVQHIQKELLTYGDEKYRNFMVKLVPTLDPDKIIGIRTPLIRGFAKKIGVTGEAKAFMNSLPHTYLEENNLHASIISAMKDYDAAMAETEKFIPYIDNWATCDGLIPKVFRKKLSDELEHIKAWLKKGGIYSRRFAVVELMRNYLDEYFEEEFLQLASAAACGEYYVDMAVAWYFSIALVKQFDSAIKVIKDNGLDKWTHNKTIQKALESRQISADKKELLRSLKR